MADAWAELQELAQPGETTFEGSGVTTYRAARRTLGAATGTAFCSTWLPPPIDIAALVVGSIIGAVSLALFLAARASAENQLNS